MPHWNKQYRNQLLTKKTADNLRGHYTDRKTANYKPNFTQTVGKAEMALYNRKTENNRLSREAKLLQCCDLS